MIDEINKKCRDCLELNRKPTFIKMSGMTLLDVMNKYENDLIPVETFRESTIMGMDVITDPNMPLNEIRIISLPYNIGCNEEDRIKKAIIDISTYAYES